MKKAFCFDICSCHFLQQILSLSDLRIPQVTLVEKRESRKHFSASASFLSLGLRPRLQKPTASASKTFPRFPFFNLGNLGKTQIRRGQILPQTWREQISKQNTIFSNFFHLEGNFFYSLHWICNFF